MKTKEKIALAMLSASVREDIPDICSWEWEEIDALSIMLNRKDLTRILANFRCSLSELRDAIRTQITCSLWSSDTDEVQHCATFMLSGMALVPKYMEEAIDLLASYIFFAENEKDADDLRKAIAFLERFKDQEADSKRKS